MTATETDTPKTRQQTSYHILKKLNLSKSGQEEITDAYELVARTVGAANSDAAIKNWAEISGENGEFVAIPSRTFTHRKVTVKTETKISID